MEHHPYPFIFQHPCNVIIVGPSGSGKTSFLESALRNRQFQPEPQRIVWIYSERQPGYDEMQTRAHSGLLGNCRHIEFVKDNTDYEALYESMDKEK